MSSVAFVADSLFLSTISRDAMEFGNLETVLANSKPLAHPPTKPPAAVPEYAGLFVDDDMDEAFKILIGGRGNGRGRGRSRHDRAGGRVLGRSRGRGRSGDAVVGGDGGPAPAGPSGGRGAGKGKGNDNDTSSVDLSQDMSAAMSMSDLEEFVAPPPVFTSSPGCIRLPEFFASSVHSGHYIFPPDEIGGEFSCWPSCTCFDCSSRDCTVNTHTIWQFRILI